MKIKRLVTLIWGTQAGAVEQDRTGHLRFTYSENWREREDAVPLSLSMPLALAEHSHKAIDAYLWGLLPDNEAVLRRWGERFQVSARSAFALLSHVGEDCAGAAQFVTSARVEDLEGEGPSEIVWLSEAEVAERLRALRQDQGAWRAAQDAGQFSLAGAQPKTALFLRNGRFGVPSGRTPTTHILKPPLDAFRGHVENEHLCLSLARSLGIPTAASDVRRFGDEIAIVVTRYDRSELENGESAPRVVRVHQEDTCQALGLTPADKYQSAGGPSPATIVELLRDHSGRPEEDVATLVDALAFSWLTAGTDAHGKNYSILHAAGGRIRLAPLYDLGSALPYAGIDQERMRLAMRIGTEYRVRGIDAKNWRELAKELGLGEDATVARVVELARQIPGRVDELVTRFITEGLDAQIVKKLGDLLRTRARLCTTILEQSSVRGS